MNPVKINEIARKPDGEMSRKVHCRRQGWLIYQKYRTLRMRVLHRNGNGYCIEYETLILRAVEYIFIADLSGEGIFIHFHLHHYSVTYFISASYFVHGHNQSFFIIIICHTFPHKNFHVFVAQSSFKINRVKIKGYDSHE